MSVNMGDAVGYLDLDISKFQRNLKSAMTDMATFQKKIDNSSSNLSNIGNRLTSVGSGLTNKITKPAIAAAGALAGVTLGKGWARMTEIDSAKAKLQALSDAAVKSGKSAYDLTAIMKDANAAVKGTAYGLNEAATAAAAAVAAGVKPGKQLQSYLKLVGDGAAVAGTSLKDMGAIFGKVVGGGRAYTMEINQIADRGIGIWQALAEQLGISTDEVRKWAAEGKISSDIFLAAMDSAVGGAAKKIGSTTITGALSNIWASIGRIGANFLGASDDAGTFAGKLLGYLNDLMKWLGGVEDKSKELGESFGSAFGKAVDIFVAIPNSLKLVAAGFAVLTGPTLKFAGAVLNSMVAMSEFKAAAAGMSTAQGLLMGKISLSQVALAKFGARVGLTVTNIKNLAGALRGMSLTQFVSAISSSITKFKLQASVIAAATRQTIANTVAQGLNAIATSRVGMAFTSATSRVIAFTAANKVAILGVAAFLAPLILLGVYMAKTGASAEEVANKITTFSTNLANQITAFSNQFPAMVNSFVAAFSQVLNAIVAQLPTLIPALANAGVQLFMGLVQSLTQVVGPIINALTQVVMQLIAILPSLIPMMVAAGVQLFMALAEAIPQVITALVGALPQIVTAIVSAIPVLIPALLQAAITLFMAFVQAIPQVVTALVGAIPQIVTAITDTIPVLIPALIQGAITLFMAFVQAIPQVCQALIQAAPQIVMAIITGIMTLVSTLFSTGVSLLKQLWSGIKSWVGTLGSKVAGAVKGLPGKIKSGIGNLKSIGSDWLQGLWSGIKSKLNSILEKVESLGNKIKNKLKSIFKIASPSRWMRDVIGKNMMLGWAVGIVRNGKKVLSALSEQITSVKDNLKSTNYGFDPEMFPELDANAYRWDRSERPVDTTPKPEEGYPRDYPESGGDTYNFYSPKALDPMESARQMKKAKRDLALGY